MSNRRKQLDSQTAWRRQALANGWHPLPSVDKTCAFKDWSTTTIDAAAVEKWDRLLKFNSASGLRVEPGMLVIDVDVTDTLIASHVVAAIEAVAPGALWRVGKAPKIAAFLRYDGEPFHCRRTRLWLDPEGGRQRVEMFGGGRTKHGGFSRQFGAYGAHTVADGEVVLEYHWDGPSPADTRLDSLPALTKEQTYALIDECDQILGGAGWTVAESRAGNVEPQEVWDLTDEMRFNDELGNDQITLQEVIQHYLARKKDGYDYRVSSSFAYPGQNRSKCQVGWSAKQGGHVTIFDYQEWVTHRPKAAAPIELDNYARLFTGKRHSTIFGEASPDSEQATPGRRYRSMRAIEVAAGDTRQTCDNAAHWLMDEMAFVPKGGKQSMATAIWPGGGMPYTTSALKQVMTPYDHIDYARNGAPVRISPVDVWLQQQERVAIEDDRYRPDLPRLFTVDDLQYRNCYEAAVHPTTGGDTRAFHRFLEALVPHAEERAWFLQWLAHKVQKPWVPMVAVIMVSGRAVQGTGRGTLAGVVLARLLGASNYGVVDFVELTGKGGRGRFNAAMADKLLLFVNEASQFEDVFSVAARSSAYENIKVYVDPDGTVMRRFEAKFRMPYMAVSAASLLIATNNTNAIKLPAEDRRFEVLQNRDTEMTAQEAVEIRSWADDPANIGALHRELLAADLSSFNPFQAVGFEAKLDMIEAGKTVLEELAEAVREAFGDDLFTLRMAIEMAKLLNWGTRVPGLMHKAQWELPQATWQTILQRLVADHSMRVKDKDGKPRRLRYKLDNVMQSVTTIYAASPGAAERFRGASSQICQLSLKRSQRKLDGKEPLHVVEDDEDDVESEHE